MNRPKTIYTQSEARRLRDEPCIHCGTMSRVDRRRLPGLSVSVDPDVSVLWYCPVVTCNGRDGFSIESQ